MLLSEFFALFVIIRLSLGKNRSEREGKLVIHLDFERFQTEIKESGARAFVVFTSDRCPVCTRIEPVLTAAEKEHRNVRFCKVDTDLEPELAREFSVRSVPTSVAFENGREKARAAGLLGKREIYEMLSK